jgi:hypothetical protein
MPDRIGPQRRTSHSFFKNIAEAFMAEIVGRMYADSDRKTPAEAPGFLLPSANLAAVLLLP